MKKKMKLKKKENAPSTVKNIPTFCPLTNQKCKGEDCLPFGEVYEGVFFCKMSMVPSAIGGIINYLGALVEIFEDANDTLIRFYNNLYGEFDDDDEDYGDEDFEVDIEEDIESIEMDIDDQKVDNDYKKVEVDLSGVVGHYNEPGKSVNVDIDTLDKDIDIAFQEEKAEIIPTEEEIDYKTLLLNTNETQDLVALQPSSEKKENE